MADNVELNTGTGGDTVAADEIAGVKHQRVKIQHGADGSATDVSTASPLPVDVRSDNAGGLEVVQDTPGDLNVTEASAAAIKTAVEKIDDWDESDRCKVNPISGQAGIAAGSGVDGATVPRVSLATDVPLPAGANAIGKLAANSGVDIGDVDVTSLPADTFVAEDGALGKGVLLQGDDGTDRHNVAVDASGRLKVDIAEQSDGADLKITLDGESVVSSAADNFKADANVQVGDADASATNPLPTNSQQQSSYVYDGTTRCEVKRFSIVGTTNGNNELAAQVGAKKFRLLSFHALALSATAVSFYLANGDNKLLADDSNPVPVSCDADGDQIPGFVLPWNLGGWLQTDTVNEALVAVQDGTAPVLYLGNYIEVA